MFNIIRTTILLTVFMATNAVAQTATPTPMPDVLLLKTGEVHTLHVQMPPDLDVISLCCYRVDAPNELDFGCIPSSPSAIETWNLTIPFTEGDDAEVRCTAVDTSGNVSDLSPNAGLADFTLPQAPVLQ